MECDDDGEPELAELLKLAEREEGVLSPVQMDEIHLCEVRTQGTYRDAEST